MIAVLLVVGISLELMPPKQKTLTIAKKVRRNNIIYSKLYIIIATKIAIMLVISLN